MNLCLAQRDAAAQDDPAITANANRSEQRNRDHRPAMADFFVSSVQDEVADLTDRPRPPSL